MVETIIFVIGLVAIVDRNVQSIGIRNTKIYYLLIFALSILSLSLINIVDKSSIMLVCRGWICTAMLILNIYYKHHCFLKGIKSYCLSLTSQKGANGHIALLTIRF